MKQVKIQNANQALELYDFGPNVFTNADEWKEDGADKWTKNVYLNGSRVLFIVEFDPNNDDVIDAYLEY